MVEVHFSIPEICSGCCVAVHVNLSKIVRREEKKVYACVPAKKLGMYLYK